MLDKDSFSIVFDFLDDDIHFVYYCFKNNIKIKNKDIDLSKLDIDWNYVSGLEMNIEMMKDLSTYLNWNIITSIHKENIELIREFKDDGIQWDIICGSMRFYDNDIFTRDDYAFCKEFTDYLDWNKMSRYNGIDELFIHTFADKLNWNTLSSVQGLSEFLLDTYKEKIIWANTYNNRALNKALAEKYNPIVPEQKQEDEDDFDIDDNIPFPVHDVNMNNVENEDIDLEAPIQPRINQNDSIIQFIDRMINTDIIIDIDEDNNENNTDYENVD